MKKWKSDLDEMQEQKLLKIEAGGFWLAYWGLLAILAVRFVRDGWLGSSSLLGEWVLFMALSLYIVIRCMRSGIWDRRLKPNRRTNLAVSLIGGGVVFLLHFSVMWRQYPDKPLGALCGGAMTGIVTFAACFAALSLCVLLLKKRQRKLEAEPEEDEEE